MRMLAAILLLALSSQCLADTAKPPKREKPPELAPRQEVLTDSFLHFHPDLKHRMRGLALFEEGQLEAAHGAFLRSARFADKAAQAMVGEMYWDGIGVAADRALAYAWMDLASERGYKNFVVMRERFWARMSEEERERALQEGAALYEEFGDAVAKPRLESRLRQGRRELTGSRTGFAGSLQIMVQGPNGEYSIDGSTYYADRYWKADEYFEWQDQIWHDPPVGTVEIGPLLNAPPAPSNPPDEAN